jgi:hypothetical protein
MAGMKLETGKASREKVCEFGKSGGLSWAYSKAADDTAAIIL